MNKTWFIWSGKFGEYASMSLQNEKVYLPVPGVDLDFSKVSTEKEIIRMIGENPEYSMMGTNQFFTRSIHHFTLEFSIGDWVIIPGKFETLYHLGEITGTYAFDWNNKHRVAHSRPVTWFAKNLPPTAFPNEVFQTLKSPILKTPAEIPANANEELRLWMKYRQ